MNRTPDESYRQAAELLRHADGVAICAGAGIGVDSGLPDFRGDAGFWRAYPALREAKLNFVQIAAPINFERQASLAWGFYGHRLQLYRRTAPHAGFEMLKNYAAGLPHGAFVLTSNVDGQFQQAGYAADRIWEIHGSIHHLQCLRPCSAAIWPADAFDPSIDETHCRLTSDLPRCPHCGAVARPNILMFDDDGYLDARSAAQRRQFDRWRSRPKNLVVVELGVGLAIPTLRHIGAALQSPLIRINPSDAEVIRQREIGLRVGALAGLQGIFRALNLGAE